MRRERPSPNEHYVISSDLPFLSSSSMPCHAVACRCCDSGSQYNDKNQQSLYIWVYIILNNNNQKNDNNGIDNKEEDERMSERRKVKKWSGEIPMQKAIIYRYGYTRVYCLPIQWIGFPFKYTRNEEHFSLINKLWLWTDAFDSTWNTHIHVHIYVQTNLSSTGLWCLDLS